MKREHAFALAMALAASGQPVSIACTSVDLDVRLHKVAWRTIGQRRTRERKRDRERRSH